MKLTYLDNSATTPTDPRVFRAMQSYFTQKFGNASEPHFLGREALLAVENARDQIASLLGAKHDEIIFTSSATESINFSHKGLVEALWIKSSKQQRFHIITSSVEHKAVLESCKHLEVMGVTTDLVPVDRFGVVSLKAIEGAIKDETVLVSIMYVNNEVGSVQPVAEIGKLIRQINLKRKSKNLPRIYFHTDATQATQYLDCDVDKLGVDLLSFTGHKIYAPKGIGVLYVKHGTPLSRLMDGGRQEFGLRGGTENVPYIVGLGQAAELARKLAESEAKRVGNLQQKLINEVLKIPGVVLTGHPTSRVPHIASFLIEGVEGESVVLLLSDKGIITSTGSACNSKDLQPSHVLSALGVAPENSHGSLRFSLGRYTTEADIDRVMKVLPKVIDKLRKMAPRI